MGSWYLKAGYESVIFVPSTPDSILQQRYQSEVNRQGLRIRVVEKAVRSVKSMVQRSDPFQKERCGRESCLMCRAGGKGTCAKVSHIQSLVTTVPTDISHHISPH